MIAPLAFFGLGLVSGLAAMSLGWFLLRTIRKNHQRIATGERPKSFPSRLVPPNIPISSFVNDYVLGSDALVCPVTDHGRLVGFVHLADVRKVPLEKWDLTEVGEIMISLRR